eukprot:TRINITY_DN287_c1_g1_i12.p1 TRINITY_DN287_c1_g1~~TRINITY_DN287_c1_g1_i12.p1  ORF type:complete len:295 (+),score=43.41 TRINITY_DN287_c1_g1_i12:115-999(+)
MSGRKWVASDYAKTEGGETAEADTAPEAGELSPSDELLPSDADGNDPSDHDTELTELENVLDGMQGGADKSPNGENEFELPTGAYDDNELDNVYAMPDDENPEEGGLSREELERMLTQKQQGESAEAQGSDPSAPALGGRTPGLERFDAAELDRPPVLSFLSGPPSAPAPAPASAPPRILVPASFPSAAHVSSVPSRQQVQQQTQQQRPQQQRPQQQQQQQQQQPRQAPPPVQPAQAQPAQSRPAQAQPAQAQPAQAQPAPAAAVKPRRKRNQKASDKRPEASDNFTSADMYME